MRPAQHSGFVPYYPPPWMRPPGGAYHQPPPHIYQNTDEDGLAMPRIPDDKVRELDEAALRAYQKVLSEGKAVTVYQVMRIVLCEIGPNSLPIPSLLRDVPCLRTLSSVEEKVNLFVVSYLAGNNLCTLYDLLASLCEEEGVSSFEELGLGSCLQHPLIVKHFSTVDVRLVCKITASDVLQQLSEYLGRVWTFGSHEFLSFLANKRSLPSWHHLGVRIRKFGDCLRLVRRAKQDELKTLEVWERTSKKRVGQMVQEFLAAAQKKAPRHTYFPDNEQDEGKKPLGLYSSCPYPSAAEELKRVQPALMDCNADSDWSVDSSYVAEFVSTWKHVFRDCSAREALNKVLAKTKSKVKSSKQQFLLFRKYPANMILNIAALSMKGQGFSEREEKDIEKEEVSTEPQLDASGPSSADLNTRIAEHLDRYVPEDDNTGSKHCHAILKWATDCEKEIIACFSQSVFSQFGCASFLEYIGQNLNCFSLEKFLVAPKRPTFPRQRVAAFIRQAQSVSHGSGVLSNEELLSRCYKQFQLRNKEDLGIGSAEDITSMDQGHVGTPIYFSAALARQEEHQTEAGPVVGRLGNISNLEAQECLLKAPLLSELRLWSQWTAVFEPQLGPLLEWVEENGASIGLSVLLTCSGALLRVDGEPRPERFLGAITKGQAGDAVAQLVSLAVLHGGIGNAPLKLLKSHSSKGLDILSAVVNRGKMSVNQRDVDLGRFVLDCLACAPQEFRMLVTEVIYMPFVSMASGAPQLLLQACTTLEQRLVLHFIGLEMGISAWVEDYRSFQVSQLNFQEAELIREERPAKRLKLEVPEKTIKKSADARKIGKKKASHTLELVQACSRARDVVEAIRREEFGLEPGTTSTASGLLARQHARIGRALHCLSHNLYSEDCHFILELVQNADDNTYVESSPALAFIVGDERIVVLNNEQGFSEKNLRALCDVGNSTKMGSGAGYIGHKGIGFKSVFRVTNSPEIHSNGFHVKFDISDSTLGFILPTLVDPPGDMDISQILNEGHNVTGLSNALFNTRIELPLKPSVLEAAGRKSISAMFADLHPNLLLFLHKLRTLVVRDDILQTHRVLHRHDLGRNLVKVSDSSRGNTYLVIQQRLIAAVPRTGVSSTELSFAFGLKELSDGFYESYPSQQQVFAFLPVRSYGLKFIVQGDFILPSSREEVDRDSAWNQWLLSEIPKLFIESMESFKRFTGFRTRSQAISSYMSFVPLDGEVLGFFSSLPRTILSQLRATPCLPIMDSDGWALPCMMLSHWDHSLRELVPDDMLKEHIGMFYLDQGVHLCKALASSIGVQNYGIGTLVSIMKSVSNKRGLLQGLGIGWVRKWLLAAQSCMLSEEQRSPASKERFSVQDLKDVAFLPLSDGSFTSLEQGPVWFLNSATDAGNEDRLKSFMALYSDLRTVHPLLLLETSADTPGDVGIVKHMLSKVGVKMVSAHEVMKAHVLPMLKRDDCLRKDSTLVVQYLTYCMLHLEFHKCGSCEAEKQAIIGELKKHAVLLTDVGLRRLGDYSIHFAAGAKNTINMKAILTGTGVEWRELADDYFQAVPSGLKPLWRKFLLELGVTDFVRAFQTTVRVSDRSSSLWKDESWDDAPEYIVEDWQSPELHQILDALAGNDTLLEQCGLLLSALDKKWEDTYEQFVKARYSYTTASGQVSGYCSSSFILLLREAAWIKSSSEGKLCVPGQLFHTSDAVKSLLGNRVPYAVPTVESAQLVKALGLRTEVTLDDAIKLFEDAGRSFSASVEQMEQLYKFLADKMSSKKLKKLFRSKPCIFLPLVAADKREARTAGRFYQANEVAWEDPFNILNKLEDGRVLQAAGDFPTRTLSKHYPGMESFFVRMCSVSQGPSFDDYVSILQELAAHFSPSEVLKELLRLFNALSDEIDKGELRADELARRKQLVIERRATILPTKTNSWAGPSNGTDILCWCDDPTIADEFDELERVVQFLDVGKQTKRKSKRKKGPYSFFEALGIPKFSEVLDREAIAYGAVGDEELGSLFKWIVPYAQSYLLQFQQEVYNRFSSGSAPSQLESLECFVADQLYFRYVVRGRQAYSRRRIECSCLLQGSKFHVAMSHKTDFACIFMEFSRIFFGGKPNNDLANFLHLKLLQSQSVPSEAGKPLKNSTELLPAGQKLWKAAEKHPETVADAQAFLENNRLRLIQREIAETRSPCLQQKRTVEQQIAPCGFQQPRSVNYYRDSLQGSYVANGEQQEVTGRLGEELVYEHLCKKHGTSRISWVNQEAETGAPYDIIIRDAKSGEEFVEVKTTRSGSKDWFEMSCNEWEFAKEAGHRYTIVRAFLPPNNDDQISRMVMLRDPIKLCMEKMLQLALIVPRR